MINVAGTWIFNRIKLHLLVTVFQPPAVYDVLGVLLEWLSEVHLRNTMTVDCIKQPLIALPTPALTKDRCTKVKTCILTRGVLAQWLRAKKSSCDG